MFDFLEELTAFYGFITDKEYLRCNGCGLLVEKQNATKTYQMVAKNSGVKSFVD